MKLKDLISHPENYSTIEHVHHMVCYYCSKSSCIDCSFFKDYLNPKYEDIDLTLQEHEQENLSLA